MTPVPPQRTASQRKPASTPKASMSRFSMYSWVKQGGRAASAGRQTKLQCGAHENHAPKPQEDVSVIRDKSATVEAALPRASWLGQRGPSPPSGNCETGSVQTSGLPGPEPLNSKQRASRSRPMHSFKEPGLFLLKELVMQRRLRNED